MGKRGPEQVPFDLVELEKLCRLNCTNAEIAVFLGVTERTVERRIAKSAAFRDAVQRGRNYGKLSLRRKQIEVASAGNATMLIWLGKQYLGQADKVEPGGQDEAPPVAVSFNVRPAAADMRVTVGSEQKARGA